MRAICYRRFGPADDVLELTDLPDRAPGAGEVRVALKASGVNPSDVKLRAGRRPGGVAPDMPYPMIIPHSDGAGVIEAAGEGVDPDRVGRRVWVWNAQWERAEGACADAIVLPSEQAVDLPDAADFATGACLGIPAMTAYAALFSDGDVAGEAVLVTGGAGAVGRFAVEMAALSGATVIATVSGPEKAAIARRAGAHHIVDYRTEDVAERVRAVAPEGVRRVVEVEFGGNLAVSAEVVGVGGTIAAYASMADPEPTLPFYSLMFKSATLRMPVAYRLAADVRRRGEAQIGRWLAEGRLTALIAQRFPLAETAAAHRFVEAGAKVGSVIVDV